MSLDLFWWNVGISPPLPPGVQKKDKSKELLIAGEYIKKFSLERPIDLIGLCEVSENEYDYLSNLSKELQMTYIDLSEFVGKVCIDMAVMYEESKLEYIKHKSIVDRLPDGTSVRTGSKVVFRERKNKQFISVFLSHWASILHMDDISRDDVANSLRSHINVVYDKYGPDAQIILMGDYNAQPYSTSVHRKLFSTKDYHLVKKKKNLLFNPFWGLLCNGEHNNRGTYLFKSPKIDRWFVFDQMMFSSSFLYPAENRLRLDLCSFESHTIHNKEDLTIDKDMAAHFDHFPIFARLNYE